MGLPTNKTRCLPLTPRGLRQHHALGGQRQNKRVIATKIRDMPDGSRREFTLHATKGWRSRRI